MADDSRVEERPVSEIEFVGEQKGPVELELQGKILPILTGVVERAYLVKARLDRAGPVGVCLCLHADAPDEAKAAIVQAIAGVFHGMFGRAQYLDILFVEPEAEKALRRVCPPFFDAASSNG